MTPLSLFLSIEAKMTPRNKDWGLPVKTNNPTPKAISRHELERRALIKILKFLKKFPDYKI
jgi:hypothetical protein